MIAPGYFLCGCHPDEKKNYRMELSGNMLSNRRLDDDGFEICPEHGERLYGWQSPSIQGPQGNNVPDWGNVGSGKPLKLDFSKMKDRRDTSDPVKIGEERLARHRSRTNGAPSGGLQPGGDDDTETTATTYES